MNRPDLNTLSKEVFEANKAKGFHDVEVSNETLLMLVITELSEAVEADRKGKRAQWDAYDKDLNYYCNWNKDSIGYKEREIHAFSVYIKDGLEDELADAVIRLLDLAGLRGCDHLKDLLLCPTVSDKKNFPDNIFAICTDLIYYKYTISERIAFALLNIEYLCKLLSIDLWQHVSLKLKYNQTRPIKHGKNY